MIKLCIDGFFFDKISDCKDLNLDINPVVQIWYFGLNGKNYLIAETNYKKMFGS